MRIGAILPTSAPSGGPLHATTLAEGARQLEAAGFDSIWAYDAIGRGFIVPDPLTALAVAAAVTERVEVCTGVLQVPLRRPVELAHRVLTTQLVSGGRLVLGVGAGSTEADFLAVGIDRARRFDALDEGLRTMRALWRGERVGDADLTPWPDTLGGPPVLIGAWMNGRWIERAATDADGWLASAGRTSLLQLREGIDRFRKLGGERAVVTNVRVDLAASRACPDDGPFHLECGPDEAADRIAVLEELGFDDVVLLLADHRADAVNVVRSVVGAS